MPKDNESTKWLYEQLKSKGYNVGKDQAEFDNLMRNNKASREWAYKTAMSAGLNVGKDQSEFDNLVAPRQQASAPTPEPANGTQKSTEETAWKPTMKEKLAMNARLNAIGRSAQRTMDDFNTHIDNLNEYGKTLGDGHTVNSGYRFNPDSKKMERTYLTPTGERTFNKTAADEESRLYREETEAIRAEEQRRREEEAKMQHAPTLWETVKKSLGAGFLRAGAGLIDAMQSLTSGMIVENPSSPTGYMRTRSYEEALADKNAPITIASSYMHNKADKLSEEAQPHSGRKGFLDMLWDGEIGGFLQKGIATAGESLPMTLSAFNPYTMTLNAISMAGSNFRENTLENPDIPAWKRASQAIGSAAIEQAVEKYADPIFKYVGGGKILRGASKNASGKISTEITRDATETLAKRIYGRLKGLGKDALGEGVEEVMSNVGNDILGETLDIVDGNEDYGLRAQWEDLKKENPDADLWDFAQAKAKENVESFIGGAMAGAYTSGTAQLSNKALQYSFDKLGGGSVEGNEGQPLNPFNVDVAQSYDDGYSEDETAELQDTKNLYELRQGKMADMLGVDAGQVDETIGDPVNFIGELQRLGRTDEIQHVLDYVNSKAKYDGMIQRVRDDIDSRIEQSNTMIDSRVNRATGAIQGVTMKVQDDEGKDRRAYVLEGNLVMLDDGTGIDHDNSDESIVIRDAATGAIEMVSPDAILSIEQPVDPELEKQTAAEAIRQQFAGEAANRIDGVLPFNQGDTYTLTDENGQQSQIQIVPNQDGIVDNGDGTVNVSSDGGVTVVPMSKDDIQLMSDATNRARVLRSEQQREAERLEQAQPEYSLNTEVTLRDEAGNAVRGSITADMNEDGQYEVYTESPINGRKVNLFTADELNALNYEQPDGNNGGQNIPENGNIGQENIPQGNVAGYSVNEEAVNGITLDDFMKTDSSYVESYYAEHPESMATEIQEKAETTADYLNGNLSAHDYLAALGYATGEKSWLDNTTEEEIEQTVSDRVAAYMPFLNQPAATEAVQPDTTEVVSQPQEQLQQPQQSALERIPKDDKGEPVYEQAPEAKQLGQTVEPEQPVADNDIEQVQPANADGTTPVDQEQLTQQIIPTDEEGNPLYYNAPIEATINDLYDGSLNDDEVQGFIDANIQDAQKKYDSIQKKAPKIGTNKAKYLEQKREWQADVDEAKRVLDYWNEVNSQKQALTHTTEEETQAAQAELSGQNAREEFRQYNENTVRDAVSVASDFIRGAKITPESFRAETGYGTGEQRRFVGMIASAENGGKSIDRLAEELVSYDNAELNGVTFNGDTSAAKDAILEALQSAGTRGELATDNTAEQERYVEARRAELDAQYMEAYGMTYEDYLAYEEQNLPNMLRKYANFDEVEFYNLYAEEIEQSLNARINEQGNDTAGEEPRTGGGNEVLPGERTDNVRGSEGGTEQGTEVPTGVQGTVEDGVVPERTNRGEDKEYQLSETDTQSEQVGQNNIRTIDPRSMSNDERQRRGDMLRNAPAIDVEAEQIVSTPELSARKVAERWWDENVPEPVFYDTEVGEVEINKNSVESSLAHRYGQAKLDAITSLVEGFENAVYLGTLPDSRERGVVDHYFAYPIIYNGKRCYVFCRAMQDANKNRLYVHEVFVAENIKRGDTLQTAASKPHGGIALYKDILDNVLEGKLQYRFDGGAQTEHRPADVSVTTPLAGQGASSKGNATRGDQSASDVENGALVSPQLASSESKDTQTSANEQTVGEKIAQEEAKVEQNPTEGQKEAGNYKKGHVKIDGYDVTIENPKGSVRRGTDADGKQWEQTMNNTYGYIRGTEGVDGDHIDIFLSDNPTEGNVYVVDQVNPDGSFDEHKVMYGFNSEEVARNAYLSNYEEGWQGLGNITEVSKDEFKKWINSSHRKTKPFAEYKSVNAIGAQNEERADNTDITPGDLLRAYESGDTKAIEAAESRMRTFIESSDDMKAVAATYFRSKDNSRKYKKDVSSGTYRTQSFIAEACKKALLKAGIPKEAFMGERKRTDFARNTSDARVLDVMSADPSFDVLQSVVKNPNTLNSTLLNIADRTQYSYLADDARQILAERETDKADGRDETDGQKVDGANRRFNEELDAFKAKTHKGLLHLGQPGRILNACGINAELTLSPTVLSRKLKQHGLNVDDIKGLAGAIQEPILVYQHGDAHPNMVIVTDLAAKGGKVSVAVELDGEGNVVELNNVSSVHSKDATTELERLSNMRDGYLEQALRWVDKNEVSDWLGIADLNSPIHANNPKLVSIANILQNFENPSVKGENLRDGNGALAASESNVTDGSNGAAERKRMAEHAQRVVDSLNLKNVEIVTDASQLTGRRAKAKGFYSPDNTGKITIVIPNHADIFDVEQTILHEGVAHYGLRELFGEHFDTFLDNVYKNADEKVKEGIDALVDKYNGNVRTATEEYLAKLAEDTNFKDINASWWNKIKDLFLKMLHSIGFENFSGVTLSDNELRYILWRSYENLAEPGRYRSIVGEVKDIAKQHELNVGNYAVRETRESVAENGVDDIEDVNRKFNERLAGLTEGNAQNVILNLGRPGNLLLAAGISDKPIKLYGNKLLKKMRKHGFTTSDVKNLPKEINNPIAVFKGSVENSFAILTELEINGNNVLASLSVGKGNDIDFNIISSVYGKDGNSVVSWINDGKILYVNKEKALNYLRISAPIAEAQDNQKLSSAANIVKNFENPSAEGENQQEDGGENAGKRTDVRFRKEDDKVSDFALKHNLNEKDVEDYADYMRRGNLNGASRAFKEIRRKVRLDNQGASLGQFAKIFSPIEKELYERFGNVDELRQQYVQRTLDERNAMEAARKKAEEEAEAERRWQQEFQNMTNGQLDAEYMKAIEANDESRMRDLVNEAARRNGYGDTGSEYQGVGAWMAPGNPGYESDEERRAAVANDAPDVNITDIANGYSQQPVDYFANLHAYGTDTPHGRESAKAINNAIDEVKKGKNPMVKVYRAVPKFIKEGKLRNGDWVTPSRKYAEMHGDNRLEGDYRIIEQEVPASQIWWDGNDINEWGFDDGKSYAYRNTKNNRKLNDLITRDDKGNIIPLSQRFNARKSDVRYRFIGEQGAARLDASEEATTRLDNLSTARQMEQAYNDKKARIDKLRDSEPVEITGNEIEPSDDLKQYKKNALEYGKKLQGSYVNKDTGRTIQLQRGRKNGGLKEVLQHDINDVAHIKSVAAIPQIIENSIYIDSADNHDTKKNPNVSKYHYYVCGLKIGGVDYTVRMVEAEDKDGNRYYDHKLTHIEKGNLIDNNETAFVQTSPTELSSTPGTGAEERNRPTNRGEIQAAPISKSKDRVLISLLQTNERENARKIKIATGWERGADGQWRYETPDFEYYPNGDARQDDKYKESDWYKELYALEDKLFDGETLTDEEQKRFDELAERENEIRDNEKNTDRVYLDDYVKDDELFKAYPELKQTRVDFVDIPNAEYSAKYNEQENRITVNQAKSIDIKSVLAHEIQHAIQRIEGFASGSNTDNYRNAATSENVIADINAATGGRLVESGGFNNTPEGIFDALNRKTTYGTILRDNSTELDEVARKYGYETIFDLVNDIGKFKSSVEMYRSEAGEVEARNVQERLNMTPEQRRNTLAEETEDVAREDQQFLQDAIGTGESLVSTVQSDDIDTAVADTANKLNIGVRVAHSVDEVGDESVRRAIEKGRNVKGWYDTRTGEIVVYAPNTTDADDAVRTVLHEGVAHYGLRQLVGEENFNTFLDNIYNNVSDEIKSKIDGIAKANKLDTRVATEEYLASLAEDTNFEQARNSGIWDKIKDFFMDLLTKAGIRLNNALSDNELRYILWRSYDNLQNPTRDVINTVRDITKQRDLNVGNYAVQNTSEKVADNDDIRYREVDDELPSQSRNKFRELYEEGIKGRIATINRAYFDSMQPMKKLQEAIAKETSQSIAPEENVYLQENRAMSVANRKYEIWERSHMEPVREAVVKIMKDIRKGNFLSDVLKRTNTKRNAYNAVVQYMKTKHGLENNEYKRNEEIRKQAEEADELFNKRLKEWGKKELAANEYVTVGKPLGVMAHFMPDMSIILRQKVLSKGWKKHGLTINNMENLPSALSNPVFVFKSSENTVSVLTELKDGKGNNVFVAVEIGVDKQIGHKHIEVNDILTVHGREAENVVRPILENGSLVWADKEKGLHWLSSAKSKSQAIADETLVSAANIVKDFENPKLSQGNKDYSGLQGIYGKDFERKAKEYVEDFEGAYDTKPLWREWNGATKAILEEEYKSGLLSKELYDRIRNMYKYYIPLKGWAENRAEDVYTYYTTGSGDGGKPQSRKGRTSESDDPLVTLEQDADRQFNAAARNNVKRSLYNLATTHKSDLLTVRRQWYQNMGTKENPDWQRVDAEIPENATPEEMEKIVSDFEKNMRELAKDGMAMRQKRPIILPYHATKRMEKEHTVRVMVNGKEYVIYVNGDPAAAQAVNGTSTPKDPDNKFLENFVLRPLRWFNRTRAALLTAWNFNFIPSNLSRDAQYSIQNMKAKEPATYVMHYIKNLGEGMAKFTSARLFYKDKNGKLDMNDPTERLFKEFLDNGGETGYSKTMTLEQRRRSNMSAINKLSGIDWTKGVRLYFDALAYVNRSVETIVRFAAYKTSREHGRSIVQSINDAKEASVNFDKHGSGEYGNKEWRLLYIFANVKFQSMRRMLENATQHPVRFTLAQAERFALGFAVPMMAKFILDSFGDDDEKDAYDALPEWMRRSGISIPISPIVPGVPKRTFLYLPLGPEDKVWYALGEMSYHEFNVSSV